MDVEGDNSKSEETFSDSMEEKGLNEAVHQAHITPEQMHDRPA